MLLDGKTGKSEMCWRVSPRAVAVSSAVGKREADASSMIHSIAESGRAGQAVAGFNGCPARIERRDNLVVARGQRLTGKCRPPAIGFVFALTGPVIARALKVKRDSRRRIGAVSSEGFAVEVEAQMESRGSSQTGRLGDVVDAERSNGEVEAACGVERHAS